MKNLKALYIFDVAADSVSFTQAAEKLFLTHGAVSKQIKNLEQSLVQSLFYRQGRNVRLTHEGKLLKSYTSQAFHTLNRGVDALSHSQNTLLNVSCEPTLTMRWLMPRMSHFYESHPNTDIRLSTAGGPVTLDPIGSSLAIRRDDFEINSHYKKAPLVDEWVGPVVSPVYWERVKNDYGLIKLIHSDTRPNAWSNWSKISGRELSGQKVPSKNTEQHFAHFYFCFQAAADGMGMAIGSYPLIVDDLKRGSLIAPFGFVLSGNSYILLSRDSLLDRGLRLDVDLDVDLDINLNRRVNSQFNNNVENKFANWVRNQLKECEPSDDQKYP